MHARLTTPNSTTITVDPAFTYLLAVPPAEHVQLVADQVAGVRRARARARDGAVRVDRGLRPHEERY